ncbi:cell wall / vacuolar inhibitor of fructosidase [Salix suchowensis]|nr:cell wall / vacuolar inhibitor of fructosidase [Salix suchowensis]
MYSLVHSFMLLTILMVLVSRSNAANAPSKLIQDICKETAESQGTYDGCVGALELDPTADSADISKLAEITATASFKSALSELSEDPLSANYDSRVAGDDVQECEDELARDKARFPGLTTRNNYGKLYSAIAFVVTNHLPQS